MCPFATWRACHWPYTHAATAIVQHAAQNPTDSVATKVRAWLVRGGPSGWGDRLSAVAVDITLVEYSFALARLRIYI